MEINLHQFVTESAVIPRTKVDGRRNVKVSRITIMASDGTRLTGNVNIVPFVMKPCVPVNMLGLYLIRDFTTGCFYVGSTSCVCKRSSAHKAFISEGNHFNSNVKEAFRARSLKYFEFQYFAVDNSVDKAITRDVLFQFEQEILDTFKDTGLCWNHGENSKAAMLGTQCSEETKQLISQKLTGIVRSDETKALMSAAQILRGLPETFLSSAHNTTSNPVYIEGRAFRSVKEAKRLLHMGQRLVRWRIESGDDKWKDWNYVSDLWPT